MKERKTMALLVALCLVAICAAEGTSLSVRSFLGEDVEGFEITSKAGDSLPHNIIATQDFKVILSFRLLLSHTLRHI